MLKMRFMMIFFSLVFFHLINLSPIWAKPLAPALYVFGDSLLDSGNNNILPTLCKANFKPYGGDFPNGPTGRFTNGRTVADFIAEYLGLPYSPPYIGFKGPRSVTGMNYASASCGILSQTGSLFGKCLNLEEQVNLFQKTVQIDLPKKIKSSAELSEHLSKSIYLISAGSNDYINNYLVPIYATSKRYTPESFANHLSEKLSHQLNRLYKLGARKIIMFEIGPVGCIPSISGNHRHEGLCVEKTNQLVAHFNDRVSPLLTNLTSTLGGSTFVLGRVYSLAYDAIQNPSKYGLKDTSNTCCHSWLNGTLGCIPMLKPCQDPNKYLFWDSFHLTEAVYSLIASGCLGERSVCTPVTIPQLLQM